MLKTIKQFSILALLVLILVFPYFVFGQTMSDSLKDLGAKSGYQTSGVDQFSVSRIAGMAVNVFLSLLGIIFIALMLYGGYLWMTGRGNEEKITRAKDLIQAAIIGLIIVVAAYAISFFVFNRIVSQTLTTPTGGSESLPACTEGQTPTPGVCQ
jgi:cytochrome bd-type quinol oxidase subunit 2